MILMAACFTTVHAASYYIFSRAVFSRNDGVRDGVSCVYGVFCDVSSACGDDGRRNYIHTHVRSLHVCVLCRMK